MYSVVTFGYFFSNSSSESVSQFMFGSLEPMCDTMTNRYSLSCANAEPVSAEAARTVEATSFVVSFIGPSSKLSPPDRAPSSGWPQHSLHIGRRLKMYIAFWQESQ